MLRWNALALGFVVITGSVARAQPPDLAPGTWWEAPGTTIDAHLPDPVPAGMTGPEAITTAWSGGAFDTQRDRLVVWGGGHGDYGGNELYAFDVTTLSWSRTWGPSSGIDSIPDECSPTEADGAPTARHSYDGIEYIPTSDRLFAYGGARFCGNSGPDDLTWTFDFDTSAWTIVANIPQTLLAAVAAYDPTNDQVYAIGMNGVFGFDPAGGSWTPRAEIPAGFYNTAVGEIDDGERLFVVIGDGEVWIWDLVTWELQQNAETIGGAAVENGVPGLAYHPGLGRIVAWNGGTTVYSFDARNLTWYEHVAASGNSVTPTAPVDNGTFGRFRYVPSLDLFVVVNAISDNVFFYRLAEGEGTPVTPPDAGSPDGGAVDAGESADGGPPAPPEEMESDCGCDVPGRSHGTVPLSMLLLAAVGSSITCRRRARSRRRSSGRRTATRAPDRWRDHRSSPDSPRARCRD